MRLGKYLLLPIIYLLSCSSLHLFSFSHCHGQLRNEICKFSVIKFGKEKKRRVVLRSYIMPGRENVVKALFAHSRILSFSIQNSVKKDSFPCV